jgi:signal transducing adaptor molecule
MKTSSINLDAKKEEEDLAKAIQLSLKEAASANQKSSSSSTSSTSLYASLIPKATANVEKIKERRKVKALYDFEAAEENEISFKAGDILFVTDDSDQNWWKGQTQKGNEGLFPSNFVTSDLTAEIETFEVNNSTKKVTFDEKKNVKIMINENRMLPVIDERKIDECIELLQNADPTGEIQPDTQEMLELEDDCYMMGPLIDKKLQHIDQKHAVLEDLNMKMLEAFQIYNNLMKESLSKQATFMSQPTSMMNPSNFGYSSIPYTVSGAQPLADQNNMMLANQMNMAQPPYGFVSNSQPTGYFPTSNIPSEMINPAMNTLLPSAQTNPQMFINNPTQMPQMNAGLTQNQPNYVDTNTNAVYQGPTARFQ